MRSYSLLALLFILCIAPIASAQSTCVTRTFSPDDPTGASGGANVFRLQNFFTDELNLFSIPDPTPWPETIATSIRIRVGRHESTTTNFRYGLMDSMSLLTQLYTSPTISLNSGTYLVTGGQTTGGLEDERSVSAVSGAGVFFLEYVSGSSYFLGQMEVVLCRVGDDDEETAVPPPPGIALDVTPMFSSMNGYLPVFLGIFAIPGGIMLAVLLSRMLMNLIGNAIKSAAGK